MNITLVLADYAQSADGKLNVMGAWWSTVGCEPATPPMALGVLIGTPWDETNRRYEITIELVDEDGTIVCDETEAPVQFAFYHEAGRPPGATPGSELRRAVAVNIGPLTELQPGARYRWMAKVDGEAAASIAFETRPER